MEETTENPMGLNAPGLSPLLLQGVLQHLDPPHQVLLQVLLASPLPLQEGDLGLQGATEENQLITQRHTRRERTG